MFLITHDKATAAMYMHPNRSQPPDRCTLSPGSGRLCTRGKQQRRVLCAPALRRCMHLGTHDKATAVQGMHLTPIDHSTPLNLPGSGHCTLSPIRCGVETAGLRPKSRFCLGTTGGLPWGQRGQNGQKWTRSLFSWKLHVYSNPAAWRCAHIFITDLFGANRQC